MYMDSPRRAAPHPWREGPGPAEDAQQCPSSPAPSRRRRVLCGAAERAQGRPEAALTELCFPRALGLRGRPGQEGPRRICEGVTGRARQVLCALGPDTDVAGPASGVTALTPTHTICSHGRIEAEQQHAGLAGLRRKPWFGPVRHGCCLWPSWAGRTVTMLDEGFLYRCWVQGSRLISRPRSCKSCT